MREKKIKNLILDSYNLENYYRLNVSMPKSISEYITTLTRNQIVNRNHC